MTSGTNYPGPAAPEQDAMVSLSPTCTPAAEPSPQYIISKDPLVDVPHQAAHGDDGSGQCRVFLVAPSHDEPEAAGPPDRVQGGRSISTTRSPDSPRVFRAKRKREAYKVLIEKEDEANIRALLNETDAEDSGTSARFKSLVDQVSNLPPGDAFVLLTEWCGNASRSRATIYDCSHALLLQITSAP